MKVTLIGSTNLTGDPRAHGYFQVDEWMNVDLAGAGEIDNLEEFAGRACYQSFKKKNPATAANVDYMKHILNVGHESILEHAHASFYVEEVSRTLTHELVRHRHLSYSQQSQRYVNESMSNFTIPADMKDMSDDPHITNLVRRMADHHEVGKELYGDIVRTMLDKGHEIKQARGAGRSVLMGATHSSIAVSGNMRAWRDFMRKRWHVAAEREIRELAGMILSELRDIAAHTFQDIPAEPFGSDNGG